MRLPFKPILRRYKVYPDFLHFCVRELSFVLRSNTEEKDNVPAQLSTCTTIHASLQYLHHVPLSPLINLRLPSRPRTWSTGNMQIDRKIERHSLQPRSSLRTMWYPRMTGIAPASIWTCRQIFSSPIGKAPELHCSQTDGQETASKHEHGRRYR